jgi:hypothetical protein
MGFNSAFKGLHTENETLKTWYSHCCWHCLQHCHTPRSLRYHLRSTRSLSLHGKRIMLHITHNGRPLVTFTSCSFQSDSDNEPLGWKTPSYGVETWQLYLHIISVRLNTDHLGNFIPTVIYIVLLLNAQKFGKFK